MKLKGYYLSMTLVCVVLGLLLSVQFKTQQNAQNNLLTQRSEDLATIIKNLDDERRTLQIQLHELRDKQAAYTGSGQNEQKALDNMKNDVKKLQVVTGTTPVRGPGVVVTLTGKNGMQELGVLSIVNELWAGGAEAIAVNGQRISMNTGIKGTTHGIAIGSVETKLPYRIAAIGDPDTLKTALMMQGGVTDQLIVFDMQMNIEKKLDVNLGKIKGDYSLRMAKPLKESE